MFLLTFSTAGQLSNYEFQKASGKVYKFLPLHANLVKNFGKIILGQEYIRKGASNPILGAKDR